MLHEMNLHNDPFILIKIGFKNIEMRLYDEKRKKIKKGDTIEFTNKDTLEKIKVKVIDLHIFKDFEELYSNFNKQQLGYFPDEVADPSDMNMYYSPEKIEKYGVVGIEIKLL